MFFKNGDVDFWDLTSGVEVALHGCSRPTAGPQKKPCSCKHPVNPAELHLHLVWSGSGSSSPFAPLFIHPEALRSRRGGVVSAVMWPTGLAEEGVSGAIHWGTRRWWWFVWRGAKRRESCILALFWHSGDHLDVLQRA